MASLDPNLHSRVDKLVRQLKYNDALHSEHGDKIKSDRQRKHSETRTQNLISKLEEDVRQIKEKNTSLRKQLKENNEDKKELLYLLGQLKDAWDFYKGHHPIQKDLKKIREENSKLL